MPFRYAWYDDRHTLMCLIAEGDWNWRDYHHAARASSFTVQQSASQPRQPDRVHLLVDLRQSTRTGLPGGSNAHLRTAGKPWTPALSGHVLWLGVPPAAVDALMPAGTPHDAPVRTVETPYGTLRFIADHTLDTVMLAQTIEHVTARLAAG